MFCLKKNTYCIVGTPEVLGSRGCWEIKKIVFVDPTLNLCPVSETKSC